MAKLIYIVVFTIGCCTAISPAFGSMKNQERNLLISVLEDYVNNDEAPMSLHRDLGFLGLPSNIDKGDIVFDEPMRQYWISSDTSRLTGKDFKISAIHVPIEAWKVPFKYRGRYLSSLTIESYIPSKTQDSLFEHPIIVNGDTMATGKPITANDHSILKYGIGEVSQGDSSRWIALDKRVPKTKRQNAEILRYGPLEFIHFPEIDDYNLIPLHSDSDLDTVSNAALNSPLKLNTDKIRERLKKDFIQNLKARGKREEPRSYP